MNNRYKSAAMIRDDAKGFMNGNYARAIGLALLLFGCYYLVSMVLESFDTILSNAFIVSGMVSDGAVLAMDFIYALICLLLRLVLAILSVGMNLFYLKIGCRTTPAASDLFAGFRDDFSRSFQIVFRVSGLINLVMMPGSVATSFYFGTYNIYALFAAVVLDIAGIVLALYIFMKYQMAYFIMHDFAEYSASEVISACGKKMKGHKGRLFRLEMSFIPYYLLVALTLGIGMLWVYPLLMEARAQFYLDLMNPKKVSGEWERTA